VTFSPPRPTGELRLGADATEMEGAAAAQICYQQEVPYIVIRGISDKADEKAQEDVHKFLKMAAQNSAGLVAAMVARPDPEYPVAKNAKGRVQSSYLRRKNSE
jgi:hypothetical protein